MKTSKIIWIVLFCVMVVGSGIWFLGKRKGPVEGFLKNARTEEAYRKATRLITEGKKEEAAVLLEKFVSEAPASSMADEALLSLGDLKREQGQLLEARASYQKILESLPNSDSASLAQERLGQINLDILFSPFVTPSDQTVVVQPGDSLARIAARTGTTVELLSKANRLTSSLIQVGKKLKIPGGKFSIVVDKSQNILTLKSGEGVVKVYPVATGQGHSTPVGTFKVTNKLVDPVWYTVGAVVPPDSPQNILGTRWMGLSAQGYGIHGTKDDSSIGKSVTAGCVRMHNPDVEELYSIIPIGTEVTIID